MSIKWNSVYAWFNYAFATINLLIYCIKNFYYCLSNSIEVTAFLIKMQWEKINIQGKMKTQQNVNSVDHLCGKLTLFHCSFLFLQMYNKHTSYALTN